MLKKRKRNGVQKLLMVTTLSFVRSILNVFMDMIMASSFGNIFQKDNTSPLDLGLDVFCGSIMSFLLHILFLWYLIYFLILILFLMINRCTSLIETCENYAIKWILLAGGTINYGY